MTAHGNTDPHREMKTSKCKIKEPQLSLHFLNFIFIMIKFKKYYLSESLFGAQNSMLFYYMHNIIQISSQKIQEYFFHSKNKLWIYGVLSHSLLTPNPPTRSCAFYVCEFVCLKLHPKESNYIWSFSLIIIFMTHLCYDT